MRQAEAQARGRQAIATAARAGQTENDTLRAHLKSLVAALGEWTDAHNPSGGPGHAALRSALNDIERDL